MQVLQLLLSGAPLPGGPVQSGGGAQFAALLAGLEMTADTPPDRLSAEATADPAVEDTEEIDKSGGNATEPEAALSVIASPLPEDLAQLAVHEGRALGATTDFRPVSDQTETTIDDSSEHSNGIKAPIAARPQRHPMFTPPVPDSGDLPEAAAAESDGQADGNLAKVPPREPAAHRPAFLEGANQDIVGASMMERFGSPDAEKTLQPVVNREGARNFGTAVASSARAAPLGRTTTEGVALPDARAFAGAEASAHHASALVAESASPQSSLPDADLVPQAGGRSTVIGAFSQQPVMRATGLALPGQPPEMLSADKAIVQMPTSATEQPSESAFWRRAKPLEGAPQSAPMNAPDMPRDSVMVTKMTDGAKPRDPVTETPLNDVRATATSSANDRPLTADTPEILATDSASWRAVAPSAEPPVDMPETEISPLALTDPTAPARSAATPADAPRQTAFNHVEPHRQIADAIVRTRDGAVEILLDPIELGRVTVLLGHESQPGRLGILVERPETLDLIRRHTDELLRDLRGSGMPDAQMDFLRQDSGGQHRNQSMTASAFGAGGIATPADEIATPAARQPTTGGGRLDIRL